MQYVQLNRRVFVSLLTGAVAWPLIARAQQPAMPTVGYLGSGSKESEDFRVAGLRRGLADAGFIEGQNVRIEYRWADNRAHRLPELAADLARHQVAAIVVLGSVPATRAAKDATATIPIVFEFGADPVRIGLVSSLNRPGANLTGVTSLNVEMDPKRLELLHEVAASANTVAILVNPANPNADKLAGDVQAAGRKLGLQVPILHASNASEIDAVFAALAKLGAGGLVIGPDPFLNNSREQLAMLSLRHSLPAIFESRDFAVAGGLMSYGPNLADLYRHAGVYTGRILKGEKPSDLPVVQPTKFEMVINLKTARTLGLEVPPALLARADEVIE